MLEELYEYYERELLALRQLGGEFARRFPQVAGRLLLEEEICRDPHVERLIESFAFVASRIHHKLNDDLPEITDALLGVIYPHLLAPTPSRTIVQFEPDPAGAQPSAADAVPRQTPLVALP
jgi:type VI secretion system protein ImpG